MRLVRVGQDTQVFAPSELDARFLYSEIFGDCCYGDLRLPERALVLDVGANIGIFTLYAKAHAPDARVRAFEPVPASAAALRCNVTLHGLSDVSVHEVALGRDARCDVPFTYYPLIPCNSTAYPTDQKSLKALFDQRFPPRVVERMFTGREIHVSVARLSRFLANEEPIDLLKIDAVGAELEILRGIDAVHWPLIRRMIIDIQDLEGRLATVCEHLDSDGFALTVTQAAMAQGDKLNYLVHADRQ